MVSKTESKSISTTSTSVKVEQVTLTFKPGQKKETPPPASGTRVFYESLYKQNPNSFIALKWCLEYGILPLNKTNDAIKRTSLSFSSSFNFLNFLNFSFLEIS